MNHVLATTLTETRLVRAGPRTGPYVEVAFREEGGQPAYGLLYTNCGPLELHIGQICEAFAVEKGYQLTTVKYRYTLTPAGDREPILRWEYVRTPPRGGLWCRHHLQGPLRVSIGRRDFTLNDVHLPTGYVTVEELIRFCIVDLDARPRSDDWDRILNDSYERFKGEFSPQH